jgi:roadblock/LC7 domain-containing protein
MSSEPPRAYIPTIYDETHRAIQYMDPSIRSMANRATLIAYLEHHAPTTDGSFAVCIAGGNGVFVSKVHNASDSCSSLMHNYHAIR